MNIINIFKKETKELHTGVDTYVVEWTSRHGKWSDDVKKRFQAFTDREEAEEFAESIRRAHKLIGNTYEPETKVCIYLQDSGL